MNFPTGTKILVISGNILLQNKESKNYIFIKKKIAPLETPNFFNCFFLVLLSVIFMNSNLYQLYGFSGNIQATKNKITV